MVEPSGHLDELLARVAPGSQLHEGLERILGGHRGALIVLGDGPEVLEICSGGFHIDAEMSPPRLSELAKMDGAIVLDHGARRIVWANVHLIPDPNATTTETGTRHRTAERVARSLGVPVVAVSEERGTITLYQGGLRRELQDSDSLIARANHLLQTLERFKNRLDVVVEDLDRAELSGSVTLREVATVLQRTEMVARIARSIRDLLIELGSPGRLLRLQLEELAGGVFEDRQLLVLDYVPAFEEADSEPAAEAALSRIAALHTDSLLAVSKVAGALLGRAPEGGEPVDLDLSVSPRGRRMLRRAAPQL